MQGVQRRAATATSLGRLPEPVLPAASMTSMDTDWAQSELSSYFKQHPDKLSFQLDRIMDKLRESQGDMQGFIVELDSMIDQLNADIDLERREVEGRNRLMRDYPDVTNEFLHFFLDGIMEAMENEQAAAGARTSVSASGGTPAVGSASPMGRSSTVRGTAWRPRSSGSSSVGGGSGGKERFSTVARRMPA